MVHGCFAIRLKSSCRQGFMVTSPLVFSHHFALASVLVSSPIAHRFADRLFIVALLPELASGDARFQVGGSHPRFLHSLFTLGSALFF
jgi:hypothetical protein